MIVLYMELFAIPLHLFSFLDVPTILIICALVIENQILYADKLEKFQFLKQNKGATMLEAVRCIRKSVAWQNHHLKRVEETINIWKTSVFSK